MLAMGVPGAIVAADPDRLRAARMVAGQFGVDLFILDDAFQHRRAAREADILLLDSSRPFGNGRLLPAGQLREPAKNIARANLIVLTRCASPPPPDLIAELNRLNPTAPVFTARHKVAKVRVLASGGGGDVRSLRGKRVAAFSAIARPDDFEATLSDCGAIPVSRRSFPDHHRFRAAEIAEIYAEASRRGAEAVVTTAKDAVRLPDSREHPLPLLCLEIEIEIGGGADKLIECVLALLAKEQF
jgi:tetraacyldisaccharide 4'-kinase